MYKLSSFKFEFISLTSSLYFYSNKPCTEGLIKVRAGMRTPAWTP